MVQKNTEVKKTTWRGVIVSQSIVFLFCVVLPGLATAIAPVSWVKFQRNGEQVTAHVQVCTFFVVPYKTMTVDPVTGIGDRSSSDRVTYKKRSGKRQRIHTEGEGFLVIEGQDEIAEVPVTPYNIQSVSERSRAFLKDAQATELKLFVVANWKFSVILGGLFSVLTVIYVVGVVLGLFVWVFKVKRGLWRFAAGTDWNPADFGEDQAKSETSPEN